ncbi:U3 small nucleolar ribonucleoprotein protein IMP3-like isoform X2 [Bolinopsis microptera]|uniref:U3 small nucleolar ribonucleoprotein protein IMP3-like isoform X2 n=1 Tax=Bolinopsis microptera TaxID=2820187 RepID=UPI0030799BC9
MPPITTTTIDEPSSNNFESLIFALRYIAKNVVRKLKHHEQKLLKKVDSVQWNSDNKIREAKVMRKYHLQNHEDYMKYNRMCVYIKNVAAQLKDLDSKSECRTESSEALLQKLYNLGIISTAQSLSLCEKVNVSSFCRRRLPVILVRLRMAQSVKDAVAYVEEGNIRVGPNLVTDPCHLVTRNMEDFITWADGSKIKRHVIEYSDELDDFDLLNC